MLIQPALIPHIRPEPNHYVTVQGLAMRLRALLNAATTLEQGKGRIVNRLRAENALKSLEADIVTYADQLTEDLLWRRLPVTAATPSPVGDIPDLMGLA